MKQIIQIRKESPVGIVVRTTSDVTVPIIYSTSRNIVWPHRVREEQIASVIRTVRAAIVSPLPDGDAKIIAAALEIPGTEAERVLRFLSPDVGVATYLTVVKRAKEMGISPSRMPWRYLLPMLVSRFGDSTIRVIQEVLPLLPEFVRPRSFGGDAGARDLATLIAEIWEARNGKE